jgi:hypothetical protein
MLGWRPNAEPFYFVIRGWLASDFKDELVKAIHEISE